MSSQPTLSGALFGSTHYFIASSIVPDRVEELRHVLDTNGAHFIESGLKDPKLNTVISNSSRFEGWEELSGKDSVHVVTEDWVERSLVLGKLQA